MEYKFKVIALALLVMHYRCNSCPTELGKRLLLLNKISHQDISNFEFKSTGT